MATQRGTPEDSDDKFGTAQAVHIKAPGLTGRDIKSIIQAEQKAGAAGRVGGILVLIFGAILTLSGVIGKTTIVLKMVGLSFNVNDAGPGIVFAFIGLVLYWLYRPIVHIDSGKSR